MAPGIIRVATYNLRGSKLDEGTLNSWDHRKNILYKSIEHIDPSIIGTQEGNPSQLNDILTNLTLKDSNKWKMIGKIIDDHETINAIFYRADEFDYKKTGTFWFNEHPEEAGAAWGAKNSKGCTWAEFFNIKNHDEKFVHYNLHLEWPRPLARKNSIPILLQYIEKQHPNEQNLIVTGDFNNWPEEVEGIIPTDELIQLGEICPEVIQMKEANFVDTFLVANPNSPNVPTFNGFRKEGYGPKIDFVYIKKDTFHVKNAAVCEYQENENFPSDHFAVYADLQYKK
ncbi:unnamed protein product [Didymodactylos carnosus]|uniref:Endonuclease/exonuclease/phosphatase domain-containing protein n=1 Tax=Didymodactylos carnosus TaxID=1234261 RepID=A0A815KE00_9BILA|nr:unnamed protein product [Didymodactylos carnosus]CAF1460794.1 unnamed protein product [Didymodactylos carnosus]CAF4254107.1 unnamed protein product [Didymodactylos carnosus]CAF4286626.1 unnamed protein product [Didymodactylos carnosus]